ncbi:hypothetical protein QMK19_31010 [Streptomyces sp. H10-C2]|uniref:hypothetical protein n=1 Tax=unclassified Streptomyces TaxID=2593676 RepID=UPI0024B96BD7|nr:MULTISPECIES: hypothetical protein [unclassified Streptomyces]MDJ0344966.1 hypothetical protein [Streptomyces sp. PH10-H1]MDJ0373953.1 hypothetical protein [Streptomyces sp. H10-C2]
MGRTTRLATACTAAAMLTLTWPAAGMSSATATAATAATALTPRIDLRVLVLDDGGPATQAIAAELDSAGTPYTTVDLNSGSRPQITATSLSDTVSGRPRAKYQAVVLPNDNPFGTGSAEMAALAAYETAFGIPQVDAYTYARPEVGLNYAQNPGYIGSLDGITAAVTAAAGPFGYLQGNVPFEDNSPTASESYGYLATPLAQQAAGAAFTSYVDAPIQGTSARGSLIGQYTHDGRRELVVTFVYNQYQQQYRLLARGMVEWMTQGIHLGANHNYFALHMDDVFLADDRWNSTLNCTPGDVDCPVGTGPATDPIRMSAADATYLKQWSQANGFTPDLMYNGGGSEDYKAEAGHAGADPLAQQLFADKSAYRWVNHTYTHSYLGCVQDVSVVPWKCATNADGTVRWTSQADITAQIKDNTTWAAQNGLTVNKNELLTGEHSGLRILPQQPVDNPNLAPSLSATGVNVLGSDNSRDPQQRTVGPALSVPRFPMNVFYNAGKASEEVDEYNWIYTKAADGGSGICEGSATSTCLPAPLDTASGYASYIVPLEARIDLGHVLSNNPRPHYVHQSNFAEDRIAYPVMEKILGDYKNLYAANTPIVNLRMADISAELAKRTSWDTAVKADQITAYRIGDTVTISAPSGLQSTATVPAGTRQQQLLGTTAFGGAYAGQLAGWVAPGALQSQVTLKLTAAATPAVVAATPAKTARSATAAKLRTPAKALPVPTGAAAPVPHGPGDTAKP